MGSLINEIFGKINGITVDDMDDKLIKTKYSEGQFFEAKTIITEILDDDLKESQIIEPLIGFLNSIEGRGLLCLGIETGSRSDLCKQIIPVKKSILKNSEQLRDIIINRVGVFPNGENYILNVTPVDADKDSVVYLIEIERKDNSCTYYSRITDYIYIRNNHQTRKLKFTEMLEIVNKKTSPKIFLYFDRKESFNDAHGEGFKFNIACKNEGLEPGKYVLSYIEVHKPEGIKTKIESKHSTSLKKINIGDYDSYQLVYGYPPTTILVYPKKPTVIGELFIYSTSFEISLIIETYENKGISKQKLTISDKKEISIEVEKNYSSYINHGEV